MTKDKLYGYKNKIIKLEQLMAMTKDVEYLGFAHLVKEFVEQGVLSPVGQLITEEIPNRTKAKLYSGLL